MRARRTFTFSSSKVAELSSPGSALAQLRGVGLRGQVPSRDEPIHLIGVEFSRTARNVTASEVADGGQRAAP